jgi:O-antigen ligase
VTDAGWFIAGAVFLELLLLPLASLAPGVPGVAGAAAVGVGAVLVLLARATLRRVTTVSGAVLGWAAFTGFVACSLAWSSNPGYGVWKLGVFGATGLLPGLLARSMTASGRPFTWKPLGVAGAVYLLAAVLLAREWPAYPGRAALPGGNPIWLARGAVVAAIAVMARREWWAPLRVALVGIAAYLVFASGSRGPIIAALVVAGAAVGYRLVSALRQVRLPRSFALGVGLVMTVVILAALGALDSVDRLRQSRLVEGFSLTAIARDENVLSRGVAVRSAIETFQDHPVLGAGLGGFAESGARQYPHNLVVEVAAESGLIGVALLLLAVALSARVRRGDGTGSLLLAFYGLSALMSGDLGTNAAFAAVGLAPSLAGVRR